jgi:isopentenyl-diphosphate delta-isomerase
MTEDIILVDRNDCEIGRMNKLEAHQKGLLHRAFSILLFNSEFQFLIQRRAIEKYHSGGLWSNTCCSHPKPDESVLEASHRRLKEEMGIVATELTQAFSFIYKVDFPNGLSEHELDHVVIGITDKTPVLNTLEASDWKYISYQDLKSDISQHPDNYTFWFKEIFEQAYVFLLNNQSK